MHVAKFIVSHLQELLLKKSNSAFASNIVTDTMPLLLTRLLFIWTKRLQENNDGSFSDFLRDKRVFVRFL